MLLNIEPLLNDFIYTLILFVLNPQRNYNMDEETVILTVWRAREIER
jgi:hypothetical protein